MLELHHIFKTYEGKPLLTDISFTVNAGETLCLLGASGSGKSTLLRMIAGLETPDSGSILFNGMDLASTPPHLRDFGLVFQDYSLFPHLNVNENVAFGLKMRRLPPQEITERAARSLKLVNLQGFERRRVTDLSGGEQQRVALARALAIRPRLLLFDEPLGALDKKLKDGLLEELRTILHRTQIPAIYVTHDQEEAFAIADRILILHEGHILRKGTPAEVWANPQSVYAAEFLGVGKVFDGVVMDGQNGNWKVSSEFGIFALDCGHEHSRGEKVHLLARPPKVQDEANVISSMVTDVIFQHDRYKVTFDNGLFVYLDEPPKIGEQFAARVRVECLS
ncbi:MAG: ABC transporter ATP-binding protein [Chloroflexi bacterium]|nr:ABC transporter ATP-binding protein [Chloroflexota bacterium]